MRLLPVATVVCQSVPLPYPFRWPPPKKNPPLATGRSLGRNGKVSRFAAAWCAVIHTRRGKLFGPPSTKRGGPEFGSWSAPIFRLGSLPVPKFGAGQKRAPDRRRRPATKPFSGNDVITLKPTRLLCRRNER